jgi:hypothetical protein
MDEICRHTIRDYQSWNGDRHRPTGLLGYLSGEGTRPLCHLPAEELECSRVSVLIKRALGSNAADLARAYWPG